MERTVVTGYGIKAPGIFSIRDFTEVLEKGICTQRVLEGIGPENARVIAGQVDADFTVLKETNYKRHPRSSRIAMAAADDAVDMANINGKDPTRIAVIMGSSVGSLLEIEQYSEIAKDYKKFPFHGVVLADTHTLSSSVASHIGVKGPVHTITTGCAASSDAILMGKMMLESGYADVCIVGGADASMGRWSTYGFAKLRSIGINKEIHETGVPFSKEHQGFVMSEGAGVLVLERESDAIRRGADIKGMINNVFSNNEAVPMLQAELTGDTMLQALKGAIGDHVPSYVNSQALGLSNNDTVEQKVHHALFGQTVPITSIKGMIGHAFGSMGAIQVISSIISMDKGFIPPTIKTKGIGFEELPIVFEPTYCDVDRVAITTHGNGGNNTCLLISKY